MSSIIENSKNEFQSAVDHLEKDLHALRAGRASASMVESMPVEAYGSTMELKGLASISIPDARTIQIEPWDKNVVKDIEKAIMSANIGLNPNTAGTIIRLVIPQMTEETRKNVVKAVHQKAEQARIAVRNIREQIREKIAADEKAKVIAEDEKFRLQEQLDKVVSDTNGAIERLANEKEEEIMTI